jgi:hypothetical protein
MFSLSNLRFRIVEFVKLSQVDSRNDSQVIFYDQVIPGSVLLGYLNADHWAIAVPFNRDSRLH